MSVTNPNLRHGDTDDVLGRSRSHAVDDGGGVLRRLAATDASLHPMIARVALGAVMLPHALQKTIGSFGGYGFEATRRSFTTELGLPSAVAFLAIVLEAFGVISLLLGFLTRLGAAAIITIMVGAIVVVHAPHGFFMDWFGAKTGEGFEYHLLAIGLGFVSLLAGGGRASVDRTLLRWRRAAGGSVSPALA
jgi:putative oxidoreductase